MTILGGCATNSWARGLKRVASQHVWNATWAANTWWFLQMGVPPIHPILIIISNKPTLLWGFPILRPTWRHPSSTKPWKGASHRDNSKIVDLTVESTVTQQWITSQLWTSIFNKQTMLGHIIPNYLPHWAIWYQYPQQFVAMAQWSWDLVNKWLIISLLTFMSMNNIY